VVVVRGFRGQFQFVVHLVQKSLGLGRVSFHVPLVGSLRGGDFSQAWRERCCAAA
jgi:hypothetical protein